MAPGEVGHQRIPLAPVLGVSVEEGQQGAIRDCLPSHSQPFAGVQLLAQCGCNVGGEHEEQGPLGVAQPGQGVVVYRPPSFQVRHSELGGPVPWGVPPDGGRGVSPFAYLRSPEYVGGVKDDAGGTGVLTSEDTSPVHPVCGPGAACSHSPVAASHGWSGPTPRITGGLGRVSRPHLSSGMAAYRCAGVSRARVAAQHRLHSRAHSSPTLRASHAVMEPRPMIHGAKRASCRCFENPPRQVVVRVGALLGRALQSAIHDTEGGYEVLVRARGRGGGGGPPPQ